MKKALGTIHTSKNIAAGVALMMAAGVSTSAMADPVQWELEASSTIFNVTLSGTFVYDADTNTFSDIDLTETDFRGDTTSYAILSPIFPSSSTDFSFFDFITPDLDGSRYVSIRLFGDQLTNAGGVVGGVIEIVIYDCFGAACAVASNDVAIVPFLGGISSLIGTPIPADDDNDGVLDTADLCPGTVIPEAAPTSGSLGNGRHALNVAGSADFTGGDATNVTYSTADTAGCSCEQIVDELFLGKGHLKNGCSNSVMESWVNGLPFDPSNQ